MEEAAAVRSRPTPRLRLSDRPNGLPRIRISLRAAAAADPMRMALRSHGRPVPPLGHLHHRPRTASRHLTAVAPKRPARRRPCTGRRTQSRASHPSPPTRCRTPRLPTLTNAQPDDDADCLAPFGAVRTSRRTACPLWPSSIRRLFAPHYVSLVSPHISIAHTLSSFVFSLSLGISAFDRLALTTNDTRICLF